MQGKSVGWEFWDVMVDEIHNNVAREEKTSFMMFRIQTSTIQASSYV